MSSSWTLLIVDDCAEDREVYREYLLSDPLQSYQILEASRAEVGLSLAQDKQCDAILLDFCLPDMSGLEFLDELKQQPSKHTIPTIMLTGQGDEAIAVQAMKQGAQDYLVKHHLQPDVLQRAVRNVIKQSHLQSLLSKTRERQRLIATTALRIRQSLELEQILNTLVAEVQQLLACDCVTVYQFVLKRPNGRVAQSHEGSQTEIAVDRDGSGQQSWRQWAQHYYQNGELELAKICEAGSWQNQDRQKTAFATAPHSNVLAQHSSNTLGQAGPNNDHNDLCQELLDTALVVPIALNSAAENPVQFWGLLVAHEHTGERQWQPDEETILRELSVQLAIAIQQAELLAQTQAALRKEKEFSAFKSQVVTTVSHEYRTPLSAILTAASTLKQHKNQLDELKQERFLHIIEDKARHMTKLVDDMLIVHQCELNKAKFKPAPLDLLQLFSSIIEEQQENAGDRYQLTLKTTGNIKGFWGDRGLLRLILSNLLSNAVKYSPEGGEIEIRLAGKGPFVTFSIQDKGIGIPSEEHATLFESFKRGSNVGTIPGTGLGLAIVKACVELHSGSIAFDSNLRKGTKVTIILPKQQVDSNPARYPSLPFS